MMRCKCCGKFAVAPLFDMPLCFECIIYANHYTNMLIKGIASEQRKRDIQAVEDLEKRLFTKKG